MRKLIEKALDKWLDKQSWDDEVKSFVRTIALEYLFD